MVLRWHIQRGDIVFPKSVTPQRIKENFELFDFELDADDVDAITALDRGEDGRTGPNPDKFDRADRRSTGTDKALRHNLARFRTGSVRGRVCSPLVGEP